jgi:anti-sigma B factor antagonist
VNLSLSSEMVGDRRVLDVAGEVDVYSAPSLRERVTALLQPESMHLVVDLTRISFIDSTGLGVLVAGQNRAGELGGGLSLVCQQERVLKLFRITGLDQVFAIFPTLPEALAASTS